MQDVLRALNAWERQPFTYGTSDCVQFVRFIVQQLTGKDYIPDYVYDSEQAADRIVADAGGLEPLVTSVLGEPTTSIDTLPDGSPVLLQFGRQHIMGIKLADDAVCISTNGMLRVSSGHVTKGWRLWPIP